ncbi:MAG TPA: signal peptide peptidase SppA [Candidatus Paceibacterota bacterium]|jgi:protease-4
MNLIRTYALPAVIILAFILVAFWMSLMIWGSWYDEWSGYNATWAISDGYCNIAVIPIRGEIYSYASEDERYAFPVTVGDDILGLIDHIESEPGIDGVMLQIDSPGGEMTPATEIVDRLKALDLPVAAYIREMGASAAYYIATGADTIIATPLSDVGSIGVTMSYLDQSRQNEDAGLEFISLSSGKYKDYGNPNRPLTEEERALLERDLKIYHDVFVANIAGNRGLPVEEIAALADGSSMPASLALEKKLIDSVGNRDTVREWFASTLIMDTENVVLCRPAQVY